MNKNTLHHTGNRKRRLLCFFILLCLLFIQTVPASAMLTPPANLQPHKAFAAIDGYSGKILMGENYNDKIYPASTTKLMTAIALLDKMSEDDSLNLDTKVKISSTVLSKVNQSLARYGLKAGQIYTMRTLFHMMLMSSYGDATYVLAYKVFGSEAACIRAMNNKVSSLGLTKTHFDNIAGLDLANGYTKNYSTALELAKITKKALTYKTIAGIVKKSSYQVTQADGSTGRVIKSSNQLYSTVPYDKSLYTVIGAKTGTTTAAGYVFAAAAKDETGHLVISVYSGTADTTARFTDTRLILNKIFRALKEESLIIRTKTTYPVYFKGNTATGGSMTYQIHTFDQTKELSRNAYTKKGCQFSGWNTKKDGSGFSYRDCESVKNLIGKNDSSLTLYAEWQLREYSIVYNLGGGLNNPDNPDTYTMKDEITLKEPVRMGYIFRGWYSDSAHTRRFSGIEEGSTGKLVLYAAWKYSPYTITFKGNGGMTKEQESSYTQSFMGAKETALTPNRFTRRGYTFTGFNTKKDCSGDSFLDEAVVSKLAGLYGSSFNLYAQWKLKTYNIYYRLDGGINSSKNPHTYTIKDSIILNAPTKEGYIFTGWYLNADRSGSPVTCISAGTTKSMYLYAGWIPED